VDSSLFGYDGDRNVSVEERLVAAGLSEHGLTEDDLSQVILRADLNEANLKDARGVTDDLLAEAGSLEGATMPNGHKLEDWIKDKKGSEEDDYQM
jgi:hypothetical protein